MSFLACSCGTSSKNKRRAKSMTNSELYLYKQKYRFNDNELLEFRQRFNSLANTQGLIDKPSFMESMGVLGLGDGAFLSERIFKVMDNDMDGYIRLDEYLGYFDVLIYGSQEEKYVLTFRMIDTERKGWFKYEDFYDMIMSMLHTWNNITGHNYNILENKRLAHFLESIFQKFNSRRAEKVTFDDFKVAVSREPQLLEIFDYFNEGIIDTVQPLSEFEHQNQALIQELEQLHAKVHQLRALIKGKGSMLEEIQTGIQKINSLRAGQMSGVGTLQVHKPDENNYASAAVSSSNYERKPSMLQSLDTKIRKTAFFEHLRRDTEEDDNPLSVSLSKARSAVIRQDGDRKGSYVNKTETLENIMRSVDFDRNLKKHAESAGNGYKISNKGKRNTLDRALDLSPIRVKKPAFLGDHQTSPEKDQLSSSARLTSSPNPTENIHETPNQGQERNLEEDDKVPSLSLGNMNKEIYKNPLGVIKEEKTFTLDTIKASDLKSHIILQEKENTNVAQTFGLKLSGEAFLGVLLDSQRPDVFKGSPKRDDEEQGDNRSSLDRLQGAKQQRPDTVMVAQKVLELEDIDIIQSKMVSEGLVTNLEHKIKLDDIKMADSFLVASGDVSQVDPQEGNTTKANRRTSKSQGPNLKVNSGKFDLNENLRHFGFAGCDEERYQQITMQIDMIADETLRIMEEIHQKRRNANKSELKEEGKKIDLIREMTAHNIPKAAKTNKAKKGNFVSFGHENWNLVLNMMLGIKVAVKSAQERPESLTVKDFNIKYIFELIPKRTGDVKDNYKICKFFDYAPSIFLELRRLFGIRNEDYLKSIGPESMLNGLIKGNLSTLAELTSSGKSGSFFYYSADGKYTLKTISRDEFHFLRRILNNYYNHIMNNPNTLMIKFFGLHKVRFMKGPQRKAKLYLVIMANVFNTTREIHVRYDLKGSTQGRITRDEDPSIALKDLNFIQKKEKIVLPKEMAETLTQTLEKDAQFFDENSIIDYSLLMGIHYLEQEEMNTKDWSAKKLASEFKMQSKEGILSGDGTKIYFFGVIDILTQFNAKKRAEYMVKRIAYGKGISAVPPSQYARRFLKFMKSIVQSTDR